MTKRIVRLAHCYRCVYTWRMRRRSPTMCPRCKSRLWALPKFRPVQETSRIRKRAEDFERDRQLTPTQRVEAGFRLNEMAREIRRAYLATK